MSSLTGRLPKGYAYDLGARDFLLGTTAATAECGGAGRRCASLPAGRLERRGELGGVGAGLHEGLGGHRDRGPTSVTAPFEAPAISTAKSERWSGMSAIEIQSYSPKVR